MREIEGDQFGPEYTISVYNKKYNLWGFLVIDNTLLGPGKGGIRMTATVDEHEVFLLARAMTFKNALAKIPFGGAKSGIVFDEKHYSKRAKKEILRWFGKILKPFSPKLYVAAPDINTGEKEMVWYVEGNGSWRSATGKPSEYCMEIFGKKGEKCGIPHEFGSTGFGVAKATEVALKCLNVGPKKATAVIDGFGNVGTFTFKHLNDLGVRVVAVSDSNGAVVDMQGLDFRELLRTKKKTGSVVNYPAGKKISNMKLFELNVDVIIPAGVPDVINQSNVDKIKANLIVEGANIPIEDKYEQMLFKKGITVIPDIVANSGGVISSYAEYKGYNPKKMFDTVERIITRNTRKVMRLSIMENKKPRDIADRIAKENLKRAQSLKRNHKNK